MIFLEQRWAIIDQECRPARHLYSVAIIGLTLEACLGQLCIQNLAHLWFHLFVSLEVLTAVALRHHSQPHFGNSPFTCRGHTHRRVIHAPAPAKIIFIHLRFTFCAEVLDKREGQKERRQYLLGKLQHKLFTSLCGIWFRTRQICQPMGEVEGDILWVSLPSCNDRLKFAEESAWWCFRLDQPSHIVLHVALCELHTVPLSCRKASV
mmetsp:Transcript_93313/g.194723  ORF Transcript_93313/g.194723 Transcript_93313/m.194723 type:complete len:207 (-) Transcript_93313:2754-3374(-)